MTPTPPHAPDCRCAECHVDPAGPVADAVYLVRGFSEADDDGHAAYAGRVEEMRGME